MSAPKTADNLPPGDRLMTRPDQQPIPTASEPTDPHEHPTDPKPAPPEGQGTDPKATDLGRTA